MTTHTQLTQSGTFDTPNASRYLQQLCKHFGHKAEATFDPTQGVVHMSFGTVRMQADETRLTVTVPGTDADSLERARQVIDKHLERFAFRENFHHMDWQPI